MNPPTDDPNDPAALNAARGSDPLALPAGTRFDEIEIVRVLAVGGFGIVYLARDHALDRMVAVKEFMPAQLASRGVGQRVTARSRTHVDTFATGLRSFVDEAKLLARFSHPAMVKVYRFWEANGTAYMVMPHLRGPTLTDLRRSISEPPTERWLRSILDPLLDLLAMLHAHGIYHRDISPDNVLLTESGMPVLLDFGAARRVIADRTQTLTAVLRPRYSPIEQYAESAHLKQGPWTDLYALAALMAYLLEGAPPPASTARAIHDEMHVLAARRIARVSTHFLAALDWALAVRPEDRPQDVTQLRNALDGRLVPRLEPVAAPGAQRKPVVRSKRLGAGGAGGAETGGAAAARSMAARSVAAAGALTSALTSTLTSALTSATTSALAAGAAKAGVIAGAFSRRLPGVASGLAARAATTRSVVARLPAASRQALGAAGRGAARLASRVRQACGAASRDVARAASSLASHASGKFSAVTSRLAAGLRRHHGRWLAATASVLVALTLAAAWPPAPSATDAASTPAHPMAQNVAALAAAPGRANANATLRLAPNATSSTTSSRSPTLSPPVSTSAPAPADAPPGHADPNAAADPGATLLARAREASDHPELAPAAAAAAAMAATAALAPQRARAPAAAAPAPAPDPAPDPASEAFPEPRPRVAVAMNAEVLKPPAAARQAPRATVRERQASKASNKPVAVAKATKPGPKVAQARKPNKARVVTAGPRELCAQRNFFVRPFCMQSRCNEARFNKHPQCVQLRQFADNRSRNEH